MSLRYTFKMADGSEVEVDDKTYIALHYLQDAMTLLAAGQIANFGFVQVDNEGQDSSFVLLGERNHLDILHRELQKQAATALELAKSWQGNVSPECQSYSRH